MSKQVGRALSHESAAAHVTGRALYADDLHPRYAGIAHAWPVQAPHAHARVVRISSAAAMAMPGVLAVLTGDDVTGENDTGPARRDEPLFPSEVMYYGQAVAWVLAESEDQARHAAARVRVDYEILAAVSDIRAAIRSNSFLTDPGVIRRGDANAALDAAPHRLEGELEIGGQEHFYLETQAAVAETDAGGSMLVHSSTQHPSETQEIVSRVLGIPKHEVIVQCVRMGGGFGGKEVQANAWASVAALGAKKLGRAVRVRLARRQDMTLTGKRHPFLGRYCVGYDDDGRILAAKIELFSDGGYSLDLSHPVMYRAMFHVDNAYYLPNVEVVGRVCQTHCTSHTAFRGFGGPQGMAVIEDVLGRVAARLDRPAHHVRRINFYARGQTAHYGQTIRGAERIERIWNELGASSELDRRLADVAAFNAQSPDCKRGLAITPVKFGISFTTAFFNQAGALVLIYKDGSVQVNHGGTEMGQGLHTKMRQIAADGLGVPLEHIRVMPTRTDKVPNTSATAASASADLNGAAVRAACDELKGRLLEVAARRFQVAPDDVALINGRVFKLSDTEVSASFSDIVNQAYLERVQLFADGYYRTPNIHFNAEKGQGKPFHYYAYGAAVSEVEVDGFTGQYSLRRVDILHDVGDSLSPLVDRGQVEGGFAQGYGWLTTEELVWTDDGRLVTAGASTYKLPTLGECPPVFNVELLSKAAEPTVVHGSKAVGEPPFMLALSAREALRAAVAAFGCGKMDVTLGLPATPEQVFWAIERVRDAGAGRKPESLGRPTTIPERLRAQ